MADAKGAYIGGVPVQFKDAAARAMISDEYNLAETYAKGNLCIYNGKIYEAIKETTGTWDATAWEETTLAEVNAKMRSDITNLTENRGHAYGEKFSTGNTDINISKWDTTSLLCIATYKDVAVYTIRKESPTSVFCLPIKSSTNFTVTKNGENSIRLTNSAAEGGNWTVFY